MAALAAACFGRSTVPDARHALGTGPHQVERGDALQRGFHLAGACPAAASVYRHVQRGSDVRLQILEERLDRVQHGLGSLLQSASNSLEELADLPLIVRLAAAKGEGCPQSLANFLQQFLQRASGFRCGAVNVPALESFLSAPQNAGRFILRRSRTRRVAPGSKFELTPRRRTPAQMFEELLIVGEHDQLPFGKFLGEKLSESPAMLDVEAVDHVIEQQEADLLVEVFRHRQKKRYSQRVQV